MVSGTVTHFTYPQLAVRALSDLFGWLKVAVLVPLQLILTSESQCDTPKLPFRPCWAWLPWVRNGNVNCSSLCPRYVTAVTPICAPVLGIDERKKASDYVPAKAVIPSGTPAATTAPLGAGGVAGEPETGIPSLIGHIAAADLGDSTVGFEFGTSPHGLSADSSRAHQKAPEALAPLFLADGFTQARGTASERSSEAPMPPPLSFTLTEELRTSAAFAVFNIASELEDGEDSLENADEIARLWAVHKILEQGRPA